MSRNAFLWWVMMVYDLMILVFEFHSITSAYCLFHIHLSNYLTMPPKDVMDSNFKITIFNKNNPNICQSFLSILQGHQAIFTGSGCRVNVQPCK